MDFDLCNKKFTEWLLSYEQNKRVHLITKVQEQLAQMGLCDDAMKRALLQISQNTEVRLNRLTADDVEMYSNWYSGYSYYHGRYSEDEYRQSSPYSYIYDPNQNDRYSTSIERNRYSHSDRGERYHSRSSRYNELENLLDDNVNSRRKLSHYRSSSPYKRRTLSPIPYKVRKRVCYSYDDNDKIRFIGGDIPNAVSDRDTFLRDRNTAACSRDLTKSKTINFSKKNVKDCVRDNLDIVNKKSLPKVEKPDVDSCSKTEVKISACKSNSEGNSINKKTETREIASSHLTSISCEILQRDRNCNSENKAINTEMKEEETILRVREHSTPSMSNIPEDVCTVVDVKCHKGPISSEVVNRDSVIVVPNQPLSVNDNFRVPVIVKNTLPEVNRSPVQKSPVKIQLHKVENDKDSKLNQLCEEMCSNDNVPSPRLSVTGEVNSSPVQKSPVKIQSHKVRNDKVPSPQLSVKGEVNSSPVQKSPVKIQSHKVRNDKDSRSKQLCEEMCSNDNGSSPRLSVTGGNISKSKQQCTSTSGCNKNSEKATHSQQQHATCSSGKNKKRTATGISSSGDATGDFPAEKMGEYDKYTTALITTKKDNSRGIKINEKVTNESDKLRITSKNISSKIVTDCVKRTSPSHYITIDEYYKHNSSITDKSFSAIDNENENKISFEKIVSLEGNSSVSVCHPDLNTGTESMQHLYKINIKERKISVSQCKAVSKTSSDKKLQTLEDTDYHRECKVLKPDRRRSSAPVTSSEVCKKERGKRRHSYNGERLKSSKNPHASNNKSFIKKDKNLQNTCTTSALNTSVKNKHVHICDKEEVDISHLPELEIKLSGKKRKKIKDLFGDEDFEEPITKKKIVERQESKCIQNEHSNIGMKTLNCSSLEIIGTQTHKENVKENVEINIENMDALSSSLPDLVLNSSMPCLETYVNKVGGESAALNEIGTFDNSNNQNTDSNASCDGISRYIVNKQIESFDEIQQGNDVHTCTGEKLSDGYVKDLEFGSQALTSVTMKIETTKNHHEGKTCLNMQEKQDLNKMQTLESNSCTDKVREKGASVKEIEEVCTMETESSDKMQQIEKQNYDGGSISMKEMEKVNESMENISDSSTFIAKNQCRSSDMEKQVEILDETTKVRVKTEISGSDSVVKGTPILSSNEKGNNKDVTEDNYSRQAEIIIRGEDSIEESNGKKNTSQILAESTELNKNEHNSSLKPTEVTIDSVCCLTISHQEQGDNFAENEALCNVSPQTDTSQSHSNINDTSQNRTSVNDSDVATANVNSTVDSGQKTLISKVPGNVSEYIANLLKNYECGGYYSNVNKKKINLENLLNKITTATVSKKQSISNSDEINTSEHQAVNEKQNISNPGEFNLSKSPAANKKQNIFNPGKFNLSKSPAVGKKQSISNSAKLNVSEFPAANKKQNTPIADKSNVSDPSAHNNATSGVVHDDNRTAVSIAAPTYRIKVRDPEFLGIQPQSNIIETATVVNQKNFSFQEMNKNLQELAEVIYTVLHDEDRFLQRKIAASYLTDELKATEISLAARDFHHSVDLKLNSFLKLYGYVESGLKYNAAETVLRRVNEISKIKKYSLSELHNVIKFVLKQKENKRSTENVHSNELASVNSNTASSSIFSQTNTMPSASNLQSVPIQHVNASSGIMNNLDNGSTVRQNLPIMSNMTLKKKSGDSVNSVNTPISRDTLSDGSVNRSVENSTERSNPALPQSNSLMSVQPNHNVQSFDYSTNRCGVPNVTVGMPVFANHHSVIHHEDRQPNVNISNRQPQVFQQRAFHSTKANTSNTVSGQQQQTNKDNSSGLSFSGRNEKDVQASSQQGIKNQPEKSSPESLPSSGHILTSSPINFRQCSQELRVLLMQKQKQKHLKSGHAFDKMYEQQQKQIQELQKQQQNHLSQQQQQTQVPNQPQIWQHPQQINQQHNQQLQHNYKQNNQEHVLHHYQQNLKQQLQQVQHQYQQNNKQMQLHYQQTKPHYQQSDKQNQQQIHHYQQNPQHLNYQQNKQQNQQVQQQMHHHQQTMQQQHYQQNLQQQLKPIQYQYQQNNQEQNPQQLYQQYQQNHQQWSPQQMQQQLNQNQQYKQLQQLYQYRQQQRQREQQYYQIQQQNPSVSTSFLQPQSANQPLSLPPPLLALRQLQLNLPLPSPLTKQQPKSQPISATQTQTKPESSLPPPQSQQILPLYLSLSNIHHPASVPSQTQFLPPIPHPASVPSQTQILPPIPHPASVPSQTQILPPIPHPASVPFQTQMLPPIPPPSYALWAREAQQPAVCAILLNNQAYCQNNNSQTTGDLVAKDSCQQDKTTNSDLATKSFEKETTNISPINQQISRNTDKDTTVVEQNNSNINKINEQDAAKNYKEKHNSNTSSSELDQVSAETEIRKPVSENQCTESELLASVQGEGETVTNKSHQEQKTDLKASGKMLCKTIEVQVDADNEQNERISSCPSTNSTDERNVHAQVEIESREVGVQVSSPVSDNSADKDGKTKNLKLGLCPGTEISSSAVEDCDLTLESSLPDVVLDQNEEEDADIQLIGEFASQPRTLSRDSGYTTPGPVAGSFAFKEDQEEIYLSPEEATTWENYDDIFEVKDEISDWKPTLQSEPEEIKETYDSSEKTSVIWQNMEAAVIKLNLDDEIICANCNKVAEVICTGCKNTCYCSEKCQLDHWNEVHHTVCCAPDIE